MQFDRIVETILSATLFPYRGTWKARFEARNSLRPTVMVGGRVGNELRGTGAGGTGQRRAVFGRGSAGSPKIRCAAGCIAHSKGAKRDRKIHGPGCDAYMAEAGCSRTKAMQEARRRHPGAFRRFPRIHEHGGKHRSSAQDRVGYSNVLLQYSWWPHPKNLPSVRIPKKSDYERGSTEDRLGNRGH